MLPVNMPKTLLALVLAILSLGGVIGMTHLTKSLPTTGEAPAAVFKSDTPIASLQDFVKSVENGQSSSVVGVYVPGVLALPVGQQPQGNAGFVTRQPNQATQFGLASQYGTVGILAHNDLAGAEFSNIALNQYAIIVYGDGRLEYYLINEIEKFQALSPTSTFSDFIDLNGSNERLTANQLFNKVYGTGGRLIFQTCIEANGDASWGRMFIVAEPATTQVLSVAQQTSFLLEFASFGMAYR